MPFNTLFVTMSSVVLLVVAGQQQQYSVYDNNNRLRETDNYSVRRRGKISQSLSRSRAGVSGLTRDSTPHQRSTLHCNGWRGQSVKVALVLLKWAKTPWCYSRSYFRGVGSAAESCQLLETLCLDLLPSNVVYHYSTST